MGKYFILDPCYKKLGRLRRQIENLNKRVRPNIPNNQYQGKIQNRLKKKINEQLKTRRKNGLMKIERRNKVEQIIKRDLFRERIEKLKDIDSVL